MDSKNINIASSFPGEVRLLKALLFLTLALLIPGLVAPIISLKKFLLIENTFSILSGIIQLLNEGQIFLFLLISGFSIIIPILKLFVLFRLLSINRINSSRLDKYLHWMHLYGKWSMLDVFVVAVLVVTVKLGAVANVEMHYGLYFFSASVLLTMFITARIVKITDTLKTE